MTAPVVRSAEFWGGLFWLGIGAFVVWAGGDLGLGRLSDPGSGFALFWIGWLMVWLAGAVLVGAFRRPGEPVASLWAGTRWQKVSAVVAMLLAYGFAFEPIGFILCSIALLLALMLFIDRVDLRLAIPLAVLMPLGAWLAITRWLKIQMPAGVLAGLLG